jgi:small subunit ribosomal protein S6
MHIYESISSSSENAGRGLANQGGEMLKFDDWGKKNRLRDKNKRGHYAFFQFKAAPAAVSELERTYKMTDSVIKFLTVKLEKELRTRPAPKPKKKDIAKAEAAGPTTA